MAASTKRKPNLPPAAADRAAVVRFGNGDKTSIINRRGRSTHPEEKSVRTTEASRPTAHCGADRLRRRRDRVRIAQEAKARRVSRGAGAAEGAGHAGDGPRAEGPEEEAHQE